MKEYLNAIESRLFDDQKDMLQRIYAPTVVAVPLADSRRSVCVLPDGELRSYGSLDKNILTGANGIPAYLSSVDGGISWQKRYAKGSVGACVYLEKGGVYLSVRDGSLLKGKLTPLRILRSEIGPEDESPETVSVMDAPINCCFQPIQSEFSRRVWFSGQNVDGGEGCTIVFCYSDDLGKTWTVREIPAPPAYETEFPSKGLRWCVNSGTEPCTVELSENRLMMLIRSSTDCFWQSFSEDGGDSWSIPEPSTFYGTDTTAFLLRLGDGRILAFWNNTKPLPEPNHNLTVPPVNDGVKGGSGEDAFTNRDAAHCAISEDGGKTWRGYREILLNEIRNAADFRYAGLDLSTRDKSVHQFQAMELPFNKVLVSVGQNLTSRRLLIFDVDWLYETERKTDFLNGLKDVSVHTYVKSVSGSPMGRTGNGHCSWNRTCSACMMPDPEGDFFEVLSVRKKHDDRKINDISGVAWNFPMSPKGTVRTVLRGEEKQIRFILTDRWYNVCDPYAASLSPFWFELDAADLGGGYATVEATYDVNLGWASVSVNGKPFFKVRMRNGCPTGLSYLILQCATDGDSEGFCIRSLEKR